jgi:hypothetical protein
MTDERASTHERIAVDERTVTEEDVRREHQSAVDPTAHWVYLLGVLAGGVAVMLLLIAGLGAGVGAPA